MERNERTIDMNRETAHVFRHSYATMLNATGASPKTIQGIIGHADISTTMNRYVHGVKEQEVEAVMNVSRKLVGKVWSDLAATHTILNKPVVLCRNPAPETIERLPVQ